MSKSKEHMIIGDVYKCSSKLNVMSHAAATARSISKATSYPANTIFMYLGQTQGGKEGFEELPGRYSKVLIDGMIYYTYNVWRLLDLSEKL
jgi:hypothetical protein